MDLTGTFESRFQNPPPTMAIWDSPDVNVTAHQFLRARQAFESIVEYVYLVHNRDASLVLPSQYIQKSHPRWMQQGLFIDPRYQVSAWLAGGVNKVWSLPVDDFTYFGDAILMNIPKRITNDELLRNLVIAFVSAVYVLRKDVEDQDDYCILRSKEGVEHWQVNEHEIVDGKKPSKKVRKPLIETCLFPGLLRRETTIFKERVIATQD